MSLGVFGRLSLAPVPVFVALVCLPLAPVFVFVASSSGVVASCLCTL